MEDLKSSLRYLSLGFELVGSLFLPAAFAYYIDTAYGNSSISWIFFFGLLVGIVAVYLRLKSVINTINADNKGSSKTQMD